MLSYKIPAFRNSAQLFIPSTAIESVPSLSVDAIAYRWRSLPKVRRRRVSSPQGSSRNGCCLLKYHHEPVDAAPLFFPPPPYTILYHYWYEVEMCYDIEIVSEAKDNKFPVDTCTMSPCWCCEVCMYCHTHSKSKDQPGKVANPARSQLNRENEINISLSPYVPENLISRDGLGRPAPRQPAHSPSSG